MPHEELEVWLEVGREGRCFTYVDSLKLGVDIGDLVLVRLRGNPMHGLVVAKRFPCKANQENAERNQKTISLLIPF